MSDIILIAVVAGIVQVLKYQVTLSKIVTSLTAVILGDVLFLLVNGFSGVNIVAGLVIGLTAIGVYSTAKNSVDAVKYQD